MELTVSLHDRLVPADTLELDLTALKRLPAPQSALQAVAATIHAQWKSKIDRAHCIEYQNRRGRWPQVLRYAERIARGELPSYGHVYLHPCLAGLPPDLLRAIDGTRRMMAFLEGNYSSIPGIVLVPPTGSPEVADCFGC